MRSFSCLLLLGGLASAADLPALTELELVRGSAGVWGTPYALSGTLDSNGNGRPELIVAQGGSVSFVEEDPSARSYREVARIESKGGQFRTVTGIDRPTGGKDLVIGWFGLTELRDARSLAVKASFPSTADYMTSGDIDGDGLPEILVRMPGGNSIEVRDADTLSSRGHLYMPDVGRFEIADITGDGRGEIVTGNGRAYTVAPQGEAWSVTPVWDAGIEGVSRAYRVNYEGQTAIAFASSTDVHLATFGPFPSVRHVASSTVDFTLVVADADGDGHDDLIMATSSRVRAIDLVTGVTLWDRNTSQQPRLGPVYSPVAVDLDGDGIPELVWADANYNAGVVANTLPLTGSPRWRTFHGQSSVADWSLLGRGDGTVSLAYLTDGVGRDTRLGTLGILEGPAFLLQADSGSAWLPGLVPAQNVGQNALSVLPIAGGDDRLLVAGAEYPNGYGPLLSRWLWTFDARGTLLSSRSLDTDVEPLRVAAAQVLDRPERQVIVAGPLPEPQSGPATHIVRVDIVDHATGEVLWQSMPLPGYGQSAVRSLDVADLDADGVLEVIIGYGSGRIAVLRPASGTGVVAEYIGDSYSILERGPGQTAKLATLTEAEASLYDGVSTSPERTFAVADGAFAIALLTQGPDEELMLVEAGHVRGTVVRRLSDGEVVASSNLLAGTRLKAIDIDGDNRKEIVGYGAGAFTIFRLGPDRIFYNGFD